MGSQFQTTLKVVEHLRRDSDNGQARDDVDYGCTRPSEMTASVYERLQLLSESLATARARGEDCVPGFDELEDEVQRLMDESPWTFHPDEGLVRKDSLGIEPGTP